MNKGYLVQATNKEELLQAELLANSLISKNKDYKISLVTNLKVAENECFDQVLEYPFYTKIPTRSNDWQAYWVSPYDYTILLDCKMIILENQDSMWDYLIEHHDLCIPKRVFDFRKEFLNNKKATVYQEEYNLVNVYPHMIFFNKSDNALAYFKLLDPFMQHWKDTCNHFVKKQHVPKDFDVYLMHSIASTFVDFDVTSYHDVFTYIDMNITVRDNILPECNSWTDILTTWYTEYNTLKIQNYSLDTTLYYHDDIFYTDTIADDFRNYRYTVTK